MYSDLKKNNKKIKIKKLKKMYSDLAGSGFYRGNN